ncbi:MAG: acyltransferase family protein, partial [Clostridia bacterium]|nr:acyltransferase family protein [Clostridia bacterium]
MNDTGILPKENGRISWIDIAKGIAILLVLLGHTICPTWMSVYIYSFHMPLLFVLSGYTLKLKEGE